MNLLRLNIFNEKAMSNLNIKIIEATIKQRPIIERLMQLYLHDFSEIDNCDVNQDGMYEYEYLEHYWKENIQTPSGGQEVALGRQILDERILSQHSWSIWQ